MRVKRCAICAAMPVSKSNKPLALTCGAGISTEITHKAWLRLKQSGIVFFLVGAAEHFSESRTIAHANEAIDIFNHALPVLPIEAAAETDEASRALRSLELATTLTLEGSASALVTNPVNKAHLARLGFRHQGQTEYLAARAETEALMMLATPTMRCALTTTHLPLRDVAHALTTEKIIAAGKILEQALTEHFGIASPNIAVAALNPHAGDSGLLGDEEERIIAPACAALGVNFSPPLPADTMFARKNIDAFLCMFHDQALIPIKMQTEAAVNITLGLPFVRTSPDHGTAFDIVGKNIADESSLVAAIELAHRLSQK